ncbi:hypothetical protein E2F47_01740 [Mycobacterium eburneum]|nr:hypothetical protein [Mycobacterium eburneum]TDH57518.1 hypothetical protein E2F47_01740 [Mycobacterium eburneum]
MPNLAQLITEQRRIRGFSYRDLEARAFSVITHQRWQQLGSGSRVKEFSEPATLRAMARALDVDEALVVLSMAKSIGLNVESGGSQSALARMLPNSARYLTAGQRHAIVGLIRSIAEPEPFSTVDRLLGHLDPDELSAVEQSVRAMIEDAELEADLDRVYREPVDTRAFMEALGLSIHDDDWWMDDVDTLARTYRKIIHVWGYREREFLDALEEMSLPSRRPTPESHYAAFYEMLNERLEAASRHESEDRSASDVDAATTAAVAKLEVDGGVDDRKQA